MGNACTNSASKKKGISLTMNLIVINTTRLLFAVNKTPSIKSVLKEIESKEVKNKAVKRTQLFAPSAVTGMDFS